MYERPDSLESALAAIGSGDRQVLAGGTDFYPALGDRSPARPVLDITGIEALRGIERADSGWRIGALTTWTDIVRAELPPAFDGLKLAAREVGSVQIQNRATIAGNLCNASPAADGVPPLLALHAEIQLKSASGSRNVKLSDFILGNRKTALQHGELVTGIWVPEAGARGQSTFLKLGARKYLVISIAMVAVRLVAGKTGRIEAAAVAVGACSEVAKRLTALESDLAGHDPAEGFGRVVTADHLSTLSPIDDVRAPADYRRDAARELVIRALTACTQRGEAAA